jgi:hypothetical protein
MNFDTNPNMIDIDVQEFAIGGKLVRGVMTLSVDQAELLKNEEEVKEHVRMNLATQLAKKIMSDKLCEFTQIDDPLEQTKKIMIRCYLAPNDQVKILRTYHANLHQNRRN